MLRLLLWWKFILRFEIMKFSGWSCLWVFLIVSSLEVTQQARVLKVELPQSSQKPVLIGQRMSHLVKALWDELWFVNMGYTNKIWLIDWLYKEAFHKTYYEKKTWNHHLCLSAVSVRCSSWKKTSQIRAYMLFVKVTAVRHRQIRVPPCQVDSIRAVRHLVSGIFHYTR